MDLKHCLDILKKRIILLTVLSLLVSGIYTVVRVVTYRPLYESCSTVYVIDKEIAGTDSSLTYENIVVNEQLIKDYSQLVKSKSVMGEVIDRLNVYDLTPQDLADNIKVGAANGTRILEIRVRDRDPQRAKALTVTVSEVFMEKVVELMNIDNINIVDRAEVPEKPVSSGIAYNSIIILMIAMPLLAGSIVLIEFLNNTIHTVEDVECCLKLDVLGVIPTFKIN